MQYIAAASIMLLYHKFNDDVIDGKKSRRFLMYAIESGFKKAKRDYPKIEEEISTTMQSLLSLEKSNCSSWDILDDKFSSIMMKVIIHMPIEDDFLEIRAKIAKHVAAWVYWFDMLQDIEEDKKEGNFNIANYYTEDETRQQITSLLESHLVEATTLCELLPYSDNVAIVKNIVEYGLPKQMIV